MTASRAAGFAVLVTLRVSLTATAAHALSYEERLAPTGATASDQFGYVVASAGDFNGDGYSDVIVGAPFNDSGGANAGRAYIYFGGPGADATPDLTLTGLAAGDEFGYSVASAGDVNGDGFDDVIVGAPYNDAGGIDAGRAYVFYGGVTPNATFDVALTGLIVGDGLGYSVAGAGDVNGDGFGDVIVGAPFFDLPAADAGRAYVFHGGVSPDATADLTLSGAAGSDFFGLAVAGAGDVNADGYADVMVAAPYNDAAGANAGRVSIFYGGPGADFTADVNLFGLAVGDLFGYSVASAGDMNGDGYADVIIGAPYNDASGMDAGRAYVFFGNNIGDVTADLTLSGFAANDQFGTSVAGGGDLNGDGYADVIVGAPTSDAGGANSGQVFVYLGGSSPNSTADVFLPGRSTAEFYGYSVGIGGDVDGDGYDDVVAGAPLNDIVGSNAGIARVTRFYPFQVVSPNGGEQWVGGGNATVRWRGHDVADIAISTDGGATYSTLVNSVGGAEDNAFEVVVPSVPTNGARIRVVQRGQTATHANSDASDASFSIVLPTTPPAAASRVAMTPTGAAINDLLGYFVSGAGDVNGDGYDDVIVGAPFSDTGFIDAGRAYVYFGGPGADSTPDWTLAGEAGSDFFGLSVGGAGDVNGDGYDDLIVGAYANDGGGSNSGRAYVFFGGVAPDATADMTLTGEAASDLFGISVAGAGDVNGDGYDDVIVGAYLNDAGGTSAGRAYVYYGGPAPNSTADLVLTGAAPSDFFGNAVAGAGDVNGDGYDDVIVGAYGNDAGGSSAGRAYLYLGGNTPDTTPDLIVTGDAPGDNLGVSVNTAGDVNGDGFADVIVGAYGSGLGGANAGAAYVFFGGPGADAVPDLTLVGPPGGRLGVSVATAGDVNGDGYADVIVGAYTSPIPGSQAGQAFVYFGGPAPDAAADRVVSGATQDQLSLSVGPAGDVNADGFDDVIIGAPYNDSGGSDAGRAYVYDFNRYFVLSPNDDEVWNVGAAQTVTWLGAEPADLWLSTNGGATYELLRHDVGGAESNLVNLLVPHTPTKFARVKVTPADPSITGADESDSTFTIQSSVALLSLVAELEPEGGARVKWSSEPGVGPAGLAGYRVYRIAAGTAGNGTRIGPELIAETEYVDAGGSAGTGYRVTAVNGLMEELELGRVMVGSALTGLKVWPTPLGKGDVLEVRFPAPMAAPGFPVSDLDVGVFDVSGRRVATLARGFRATSDGAVSLRWSPGGAKAGLYFVRAAAPSVGYSAERKVMVIR